MDLTQLESDFKLLQTQVTTLGNTLAGLVNSQQGVTSADVQADAQDTSNISTSGQTVPADTADEGQFGLPVDQNIGENTTALSDSTLEAETLAEDANEQTEEKVPALPDNQVTPPQV